MKYKKLIIIGAPRSGTNMLRDILTKIPGIGTWPCDEINYIWRYGNASEKDDEFGVEMAHSKNTHYIQKKFDQLACKYNLDVVVEKTCANSLRVEFVDKVIPDAQYIFIVRNGMDVAGSASLRWKSKLNISYILKKIPYIPLFDIPLYGFRYISSRIYKLFSKEKRLSLWGPKFKDLDLVLENHTLEETCALQWKRCVDVSEDFFKNTPKEKFVKVKYEDLVTNPKEELLKILKELNIPIGGISVKDIVKSVNTSNIKKGRRSLDKNQFKSIFNLIKKTLERQKYEI
jgi:hypothetical protein